MMAAKANHGSYLTGWDAAMKHEEWDWPERPPTHRRRRFYQTTDVYRPSGWSSPRTRKIVDIYWRVTITAIKMLLAIPLSIMLVGSLWLLWILIALLLR
jgi:hypothetical protein